MPFLAEAHDRRTTITASELSHFTPQELWPLVQAVMGEGSPTWQRRAWSILQQDQPDRWQTAFQESFNGYVEQGDLMKQIHLLLLAQRWSADVLLPQLLARVDVLYPDVEQRPGALVASLTAIGLE